MTTPSVPGYSLQQAQRDIASLRGQFAHLLAVAQLLSLTVDTSFTAPDGSAWTTSGLAMGSNTITGQDTSPQAIGLTASWTNRGAGFPVLSCVRLPLAPSLMFIMGEIFSPSGGHANPVTAATLGAGFRPATEQPVNVRIFSGTPTVPVAGFLRASVSTSGALSIAGIAPSTQYGYQIFGVISLTL